jgi:hypothetical protein
VGEERDQDSDCQVHQSPCDDSNTWNCPYAQTILSGQVYRKFALVQQQHWMGYYWWNILDWIMHLTTMHSRWSDSHCWRKSSL